MASADLQRQCHELLDKLRSNQRTLKQALISENGQHATSLDNNLQTHLSEKKPEYARQKLKSIMKPATNGDSYALGSAVQGPASKCSEKSDNTKPLPNSQESEFQGKSRLDQDERSRLKQGEREEDQLKVTDAMQDYFQSRSSSSLLEGGTDSFQGPVSTEDNTRPQPIAKPVTPTAVRRRRIIDRNIHVDSKLSEADLEELERGGRGLNFSYSEQLFEEDTSKKSQSAGDTNQSNNSAPLGGTSAGGDDLEFHKSLLDRGNNRKLNNFIKDTTIKPKSILNSSNYSKQGPGVNFQTSANSSGNSSMFRNQAGDRRLLGYDWIAALVHNDAGLMEESESYFHELREFRRSNRDECCNDFYMDGPFTLTQTEPPEVEQAINETKVQPYTVNERLFTEPVTENLLGQPIDREEDQKRKLEPSKDQPRFVRVSIPRSTLQLPYKVQAHRRRSFDASDSCSLSDHCLMGWNAVSPATLPTASSVSLTDAVSGINPRHATTLAEAEKAAATFHWPLLEDPRPKSAAACLPTWRKQYMDTTNNFPHPDCSSLSLSSSLAGSRLGGTSGSLRQKTDALLGSTYSMMYEMQKAREQRELERKKQSGRAAS